REDDDVPVALLHGVGLDRTVWARVEALLGRRTMALDLPGHGAQPPLTAPTTLAEMAADVALRLPPGPIHLVGFSLGVVGLITPWNSPMTLTLSKLAPALAAGNTAVIKPSEYTSRTILRLAELAYEAGFPAGVVNVVTGLGAEAG
ncbi:aldehyde dehydrogenase family protein, partial [Mycobacterium tuberculosis]|nr:aldehyde dehydrogenase family protein [Mycobacterium tuberculosis]